MAEIIRPTLGYNKLSAPSSLGVRVLNSVVHIAGSAVALHCCMAHAKINGKIKNSTPCKIVIHEGFNLKLGTRDYVADATHHATLGSNRPSVGSPQIGET